MIVVWGKGESGGVGEQVWVKVKAKEEEGRGSVEKRRVEGGKRMRKKIGEDGGVEVQMGVW